ncbi:hypothetical protein FOA52_003782 [Chlamydomonas sp. UWO 241]|nr:hypothetical protein FOA52_003782 [Chlamydomonas sp. UWO 241]
MSIADEIAGLARTRASDVDFDSPYIKEAQSQGLDLPWWEKLLGAGFRKVFSTVAGAGAVIPLLAGSAVISFPAQQPVTLAEDAEDKRKMLQLVVMADAMIHGRPMTEYESEREMLKMLQNLKILPKAVISEGHWTQKSGWPMLAA